MRASCHCSTGRRSANPKLLIGYSDTTALHCAIAARCGFPTLHAPNAASSWEKRAGKACGGSHSLPMSCGRRCGRTSGWTARADPGGGTARGRLLGGNLTILSTLMGTGWLPPSTARSCFSRISTRIPTRLIGCCSNSGWGVMDRVSGVVFGQCTRCDLRDPDYAGFTLDDVLNQHLGDLRACSDRLQYRPRPQSTGIAHRRAGRARCGCADASHARTGSCLNLPIGARPDQPSAVSRNSSSAARQSRARILQRSGLQPCSGSGLALLSL